MIFLLRFGVAPQIPSDPNLNYVGVGLTVLSIFTFFFVKTEDIETMNSNVTPATSENIFERRPLLDAESHIHGDYLSINSNSHSHDSNQSSVEKSRLEKCMDRISDKNKKILAIVLSIFCGVMSGEPMDFTV